MHGRHGEFECPRCAKEMRDGQNVAYGAPKDICKHGFDMRSFCAQCQSEKAAEVARLVNPTPEAKTIDATLAERGERYGDFSDHAALAQGLMFRLQKFNKAADNERGFIEPWRDRLDDVQRQALTVIVDKIARILSGDPNYDDNWHDIQGYAKLVEDRLPKAT